MALMLYAKSISWIDDCRIPFVDESDKKQSVPGGKVSYTNESWGQQAGLEKQLQPKREPNTQGRFPANILVSDDMLNDGIISKSMKGGKGKALPNSDGKNDGKRMRPETIKERGGFDDKGTNSRYYDIDKWFDNLLKSCE